MDNLQEPQTRSRTLLFLSIRDSRAPISRFRPSSRTRAIRARTSPKPFVIDDVEENEEEDDSEHGRLLPDQRSQSEGHVAIDEVALPPAWEPLVPVNTVFRVETSQQVESILQTVHAKVNSLDKLHAKHALPGFADRTAEERDIERLTSEITRDFRRCHTLIQRIQADPSQQTDEHTFPPQKRRVKPPSANAVLTAKNVQRGLAIKIQEASALFRKKQKVYMDRLQGHAIKNQDLLIASGAISSHGSEGLFAVEEDMAASQSQLSTQAPQAQMDAQTQERTRELSEIAKSIAALADLFKDLSSLVIEQGTILDSVEYNIERTADSMEGAVKELKVAQSYQRNTGRRQCICFLVLLIFAAIVVLIFKPRRT